MDNELLRRYAETDSEEAFAELVRRRLDLVYSAALRQVNGDAHLAQEVAQSVFTDLARKAAVLWRRQVLTGWLYTSTHFAAAKAVRSECRRRAHEQKAHAMHELLQAPAPELDWDMLAPVLDEVMHELNDPDREVLLLRFFENCRLAEIGERLGLSEEAARKRVDRALEKLRGFLLKRGVTTTAALATLLSANAVQVAPAGLAATLTSASLAGAAGAGVTLTTIKLITMTKLKIGLIGAIAAAGVAIPLAVQHQTQNALRLENQSLQQQIAQLKSDNEALSNRAAPAADSATLPPDHMSELLRLRGEVGLLRRQTNELGQLAANARQSRSQGPNSPGQPPSAPLPEDYPKTPDDAAKAIMDVLSQCDWDKLFSNFMQPGAPREVLQKKLDDPSVSNYVANIESTTFGQATNTYGDKWAVPYKMQFKDGTTKEWQLYVEQDRRTHRWYFDGGF
jgi:RNA polymerase sigma factor (sigma-70 family)